MELNLEGENQLPQFDLLIHADVVMGTRASLLTPGSCLARFMCKLTGYDAGHDAAGAKDFASHSVFIY